MSEPQHVSISSITDACACCTSPERGRTITGRERQLPVAAPAHQDYTACSNCGTWYATDTPATFDTSEHYPAEYYSFAASPDSALTRWLRGTRARHVTGLRSILGDLLVRRSGVPDGLAAFARLDASPSSKILDVGAGGGRLVRDVHAAGFRTVVGCDAYGADVLGPPRLIRGALGAVPGTWDVIMYHHCLEHIDDPAVELGRARSRLDPGGRILVRVPLSDSQAADEYGDRWVQLDAPRHRVIPTSAGMHALAARVGLIVEAEWRDSSGFQFWGSELYREDIALRNLGAGPESRFSKALLEQWSRRAAALNASGRGDQGAFILRVAPGLVAHLRTDAA